MFQLSTLADWLALCFNQSLTSTFQLSTFFLSFQDVFRQTRDQYIKNGDGFLLVYSITDGWSSHSLAAFREQILAVKGKTDKIIPEIPLVLVGNKVRRHFFLLCLIIQLSLYFVVITSIFVPCSCGA